MISSIGLKLGNLKETSTGNLLTYISVLSLAISLCESLKRETKKQGKDGVNLSKSVKQLVSHISSLKAIRTKLIQKLTKANGLKVHMTNICSEITLHTDESHSFVCCLSSLNLEKYDEWKDTNLVYDATWFLDGVLEEFIQRAKGLRGFENSVRSAVKGRALGLGVLGWHSLLQKNGIAFEGLMAQFKTREIFSKIKIETERASRALAEIYGEPLWCVGTGMRNTHLRAMCTYRI